MSPLCSLDAVHFSKQIKQIRAHVRRFRQAPPTAVAKAAVQAHMD